MSKTLLLLRHGHAAAKSIITPDLERRLDNQGIKEIQSTAKQLLTFGKLSLDQILLSDAIRTQQTFEIVQKTMNFKCPVLLNNLLYSGSLPEILTLFIDFSDSVSAILVIGHNPILSDIASVLTGNYLNLATGHIVILSTTLTAWSQAMTEQGHWTLERTIKPQ